MRPRSATPHHAAPQLCHTTQEGLTLVGTDPDRAIAQKYWPEGANFTPEILASVRETRPLSIPYLTFMAPRSSLLHIHRKAHTGRRRGARFQSRAARAGVVPHLVHCTCTSLRPSPP